MQFKNLCYRLINRKMKSHRVIFLWPCGQSDGKESRIMSRTVFSIKTNADPNVVMQFLSIELPRIGYANKSHSL